MSRSAIAGKSVSTQAFLKDQAIQGRLPPGRHLSPTDLADQFRVSVTPIRDALVRLTEQGFLTWTATRGYFTKPFSIAEQRDLFQVVYFGVQSALMLGAGTAEETCWAPFLALKEHPGLDAATEADAAAQQLGGAIEQLLQGAADASGNAVLAEQVRNGLERTHLVRRLILLDPQARLYAAQAFGGIAEAARAGDFGAMTATVHGLLDQVAQRLPGAVALANSQALQSPFP